MSKIKSFFGVLLCKIKGHGKLKKKLYFQREVGALAFSHKEQYRLITDEYCERCGKLVNRRVSRLYTKREILALVAQ